MRIIWIDIDSLRPDHLGCYGYNRNTSPSIDRLAAQSTVFLQCFASDTPCLPSRTAMSMARFGINSGVSTHEGKGQQLRPIANGHRYLEDRTPPIALLGENRRTASISSFAHRHKAPWFSAVFRESYNPPQFRNGLETAEDVTAVAMDWLSHYGREERWMLHVNYWDAHHPYPITKEDVQQFRKDNLPSTVPDHALITKHREWNGVRTAAQWNAVEDEEMMAFRPKTDPRIGSYPMLNEITSPEDVQYLVDGYDTAIRKVDAHVERLLDQLKTMGVYDETIIIVTSDHGDAFGEHGIYAEHALAHPPTQHVPLIVKWPGAPARRHDQLIYQFDLMATLTEADGHPLPASWDAKSFLNALRGDSFTGRDYLVCSHGTFTFSRSVTTRDWLYIAIMHPGLYDFPQEMLHLRNGDPFYENNLIHEEPFVAEDMRNKLMQWLERFQHINGGEDPLLPSETNVPFIYSAPAPYIKRLEEAGDTEKLDRLLKRLASIQ